MEYLLPMTSVAKYLMKALIEVGVMESAAKFCEEFKSFSLGFESFGFNSGSLNKEF